MSPLISANMKFQQLMLSWNMVFKTGKLHFMKWTINISAEKYRTSETTHISADMLEEKKREVFLGPLVFRFCQFFGRQTLWFKRLKVLKVLARPFQCIKRQKTKQPKEFQSMFSFAVMQVLRFVGKHANYTLLHIADSSWYPCMPYFCMENSWHSYKHASTWYIFSVFIPWW